MNHEALVKLMEEMIDLKIGQHAQLNVKANPEVTRILEDKRIMDRTRLEQIKVELVQLFRDLGKKEGSKSGTAIRIAKPGD